MRAGTFVAFVALFFAVLAANAQSEDAGMAAFDRHCVHCHGPHVEAVGTVQLRRTRGEQFALLAERTDLAAPYIEFVVRNGLKAMPAFVPSDLTEEQLDALAVYLTRR
jgi:mono/diheme cytochrome c family protein